jgi:hypothetical protein
MGTATDLQLDCDRYKQGELVHTTPRERIFALDVAFTANIDRAKETTWTCQRKGDAITCSP